MARLLTCAVVAIGCAGIFAPPAFAEPAHAPCTSLPLTGDLGEVVAACDTLIKAGSLEGDDLAEALRYQGNAYFRSGQFRQAFENYGHAAMIRPDWPVLLWNYGNAASVLGLTDLAFASQKRAIEIDPRFSPAYTAIGVFLAQRGDREGALAQYDKALSVNPKDYHARLNRALTYNEIGRPLDALHDFDALLDEDEAALNATYVSWNPRPGLDFVSVVRNNRATALKFIGSYDEALAELAVQIERKPEYAPAVLQRAQLVVGLSYDGLYEEALASINTALGDQPDDASLILIKAHLYDAMNNRQAARITLTESSRFDSVADGAFFLDRSRAWGAIEDFDQAEADARAAMSRDAQTATHMVDRMRENGFLMDWEGLDPEVAMANALAACVRASSC